MSWCLCTECPSSGGPRPGKGTPARCCLWQHDKVDFVLVGKTTDWMQQLLQGEKKEVKNLCWGHAHWQEARRKQRGRSKFGLPLQFPVCLPEPTRKTLAKGQMRFAESWSEHHKAERKGCLDHV